eukprot:NODE_4474_length_658_cov_30.752053_g3825_i0.p2 GENE.NODE_4474_length_658_cov_30.752053_g3825_i0~~NODE_4474_length_658_cov_30.752053_g3825_i0.p2  ORF type:complete len:71 (-),score=14.43 NODE_4474_length_658_cov_30.752053_g3825_i0:176-388(-)
MQASQAKDTSTQVAFLDVLLQQQPIFAFHAQSRRTQSYSDPNHSLVDLFVRLPDLGRFDANSLLIRKSVK